MNTKPLEKPGYHITDIPKGVYGSMSKVSEEMAEVNDAWAQECSIMAIIELTDLLGAVEAFVGHGMMKQCMELGALIVQVDQRRKSWFKPNPVKQVSDIQKDINSAIRAMEQLNVHSGMITHLVVSVIEYLATFNLTIEDAMKMSTITKRAFINGRRTVGN